MFTVLPIMLLLPICMQQLKMSLFTQFYSFDFAMNWYDAHLSFFDFPDCIGF